MRRNAVSAVEMHETRPLARTIAAILQLGKGPVTGRPLREGRLPIRECDKSAHCSSRRLVFSGDSCSAMGMTNLFPLTMPLMAHVAPVVLRIQSSMHGWHFQPIPAVPAVV